MILVKHADIYQLKNYGLHLKNLSDEDKRNRFGFAITDMAIDNLILQMVYNPTDHELWYAIENNMDIVGFGHMAKNTDESWELAVSVDKKYQRRGVGNSLIEEMLGWAKFHKINEVFMHCIEDNKVIQHLASKHNLETRERGFGERTAAMEVPAPNILEFNSQLFKEQSDILNQITELRGKLMSLWFNRKV